MICLLVKVLNELNRLNRSTNFCRQSFCLSLVLPVHRLHFNTFALSLIFLQLKVFICTSQTCWCPLSCVKGENQNFKVLVKPGFHGARIYTELFVDQDIIYKYSIMLSVITNYLLAPVCLTCMGKSNSQAFKQNMVEFFLEIDFS